MREIKFKVVSGDKLIGVETLLEKGWYFQLYTEEILRLRYGTITPDVGEVLRRYQFSGLKDKNGNDIYEGDIILLYKMVVPVVFAEGAFGYYSCYESKEHIALGKNYNFNWVEGQSEIIEVIGNIYEDKHLLNGE